MLITEHNDLPLGLYFDRPDSEGFKNLPNPCHLFKFSKGKVIFGDFRNHCIRITLAQCLSNELAYHSFIFIISDIETFNHWTSYAGPDRDLDQDSEVTIDRSLFIDRPSSIP